MYKMKSRGKRQEKINYRHRLRSYLRQLDTGDKVGIIKNKSHRSHGGKIPGDFGVLCGKNILYIQHDRGKCQGE